MIIRKPYAFIIKNFKILHLALFTLLAYVLYKSTKIFTFFNNYATKSYVEYYEDFSKQFVGFGIFFIIIIILLVNGILFYLLKLKNKRTKYYLMNIGYYLILIILLIIINNIFTQMNYKTNSVSVKDAIAIRDIILMVIVPQYILTIFCFLRGVGFDVKSFNFKKDLIELEILEEDNEEVEILAPKDTYKIMRTIRKIIRECKYFVLEHKFLFTIGSGFLGVVILIMIISDRSVYTNNYNQKDSFTVNGITFKINESYLTDIDYAGKIINEKYYYLILDVIMKNSSSEDIKFQTQDLPLIAGSKTYYPTLSKNDYFLDYGNGYNGINKIESNSENNYLIIYEIDKTNYKDMHLNLVNSYLKNGKNVTNKRNIKINPKKVFKEKTELIGNYNLKEEVLLGESNLKKSNITIESYEINNSFTYKYEYYNPFSSKTINGYITVKSNIKNDDYLVMMIESDYEVDTDLYISEYLPNSCDFLSYFASLKYEINNKEYTISKLNLIDLKVDAKYLSKNITYITVPSKIKSADTINLIINIRDKEYNIKLK